MPPLVFAQRGVAEQRIDFGHLEAGDRDIEIEIEAGQVLQLDLQDLGVPADRLGELVVSQDLGALLHITEVAGRFVVDAGPSSSRPGP